MNLGLVNILGLDLVRVLESVFLLGILDPNGLVLDAMLLLLVVLEVVELLLSLLILLAQAELELNLDLLRGGGRRVHDDAVLVLAEGSLARLGEGRGGLGEQDHVDGVVVVEAEDVENRLEVGVTAFGVQDGLEVEAVVFAEVGFNLPDLLSGLDVLNVLLQGHRGEVGDLLGNGERADVEVSQVDGLVGGGRVGVDVDFQLAREDIEGGAHVGGKVDN